MSKYLLDTSVLLQRPEVLAKVRPGLVFVVPGAVLRELQAVGGRRPERSNLLSLIRDAIRLGDVQVPEEKGASALQGGQGLSADVSIALLMAQAREAGEDLTLATEDRHLVRAASELGIPVLDAAGLDARLGSAPAADEILLKQAQKVRAAQRGALLRGLIGGLAAGLLGNVIASKFSLIVSTINVWGTLLLLLAIACLLYWCRGRYRLMYGSAEVFVGFSAAARVFWPRFVYAEAKASDVFQVLAGLYIMIRGFDNMGKALAGTRWEKSWRRFSGE